MVEELKKIDPRQLDFILWLSSPALAKNEKKREMLYCHAVSIGEQTAHQYVLDRNRLEEEAYRLGITAIQSCGEHEKTRAYYLPDTKEIFCNSFFAAEMADFFVRENIGAFSAGDIRNALICHELFHHIEHTFSEPVDVWLKKRYKTSVSPIYRDMAAFAFTNHVLDTRCQLVDLFWLKMHHFETYQDIIEKL